MDSENIRIICCPQRGYLMLDDMMVVMYSELLRTWKEAAVWFV